MKYAELTTKKARISYIRLMLTTNAAWAIRGLLRIYDNQTSDEQSAQSTRYWNDIGFNGVDANILSSFAEQVKKGRTLSPKQMAIVHKKMPKYAKQLESIAAVSVRADLTEQMRDPNEEEQRVA